MTRVGLMHNRIKKILRNNSGFTLIELLVVLILMGILLSVTIVGGLAWQDWAQFRQEEAVAEEIFFAAQNQLTELDSSGALKYKLTDKLKEGAEGTKTYNAMFYINEFENVKYAKNGDSYDTYKLDTIWKNANLTNEPGNLLKLQAAAGDYQAYLDGNLYDGTDAKKDKLGAKLLFDIIAPYVSDRSVLNGAIILEFSPESGQVFSVCYSDRANNLVYSDDAGDGNISVMNRVLQEREKVMLGYYSIDQLTQKVRGRGKDAANLDFQIINDEVLEFVIDDKDKEMKTQDSLGFKIYDGKSTNEVMSFNISSADIQSKNSYEEGLIAAEKNPAEVTVTFGDGLYSSDKKFNIPVFRVSTGEIYVIMDAADVQAESLAYSKSVYFDNTLADSAEDDGTADPFRKTYSFYRFGLSKTVNYIYGEVFIEHKDSSGNVISTTDSAYSYSDPQEGFHKDQSGTKGECTTFAKYEKSGDEATIELTKVRHLFNVRYETDYKTSDRKNIKNTFILKDNMSWDTFVGKNDGVNYFLNSKESGFVTGINYDGANISSDLIGKDTVNYPFPGFRKLDKNDTFTQDENDKYAISDLKISITGNITYGVYDSEADAISTKCKDDYKYTQGEKASFSENDSESNNAARAGRMPLGLFAENLGTISNIVLNRHTVKGMELMNNSSKDLVYTCMVGGFAGNNIGSISNLTMLDNVENSSTSDKANKSKINGRTDVGGIIGRQSFVVEGKSEDITISGMSNYAKVSGLENVGGIVGRAYTRYVDGSDASEDEKNFKDIYQSYGNAYYGNNVVSSYEQIINKYCLYHDGYTITDTYKSMTGEKVSRNNKITIENCTNRGLVSGDELAYTQLISKNAKIYNKSQYNTSSARQEQLRACSFIGGIAGMTADGVICDYNQVQADNSAGTKTSIYRSLLSSYVNGGDGYVKVKNCNSFVEYDLSNVSNIGDENTYKSLKYDNYVGGLIGYSRLTVIENCNTKPDASIKKVDGVSQTYVLGNRFVGGLVGCSDLTRYDLGDATANSDGYNNRVYAATNYNNVIGKLYVGGIAGGFGVGGLEAPTNHPERFSFRNPSINAADNIESTPGEVLDRGDSKTTPVLAKNILNTGVVLCLKSGYTDNPFYSGNTKPANYTGYCGGITGNAYARISNADNIQSQLTKEFELKLINNGDAFSFDGMEWEESVNKLVEVEANSKFGGNKVGGIFGYSCNGNKINWNTEHSLYVDAVVFGEDYVGGLFGDTGEDSYPFAYEMYPVKKNSQSNGMLVLGSDVVGGLYGRLPHDMILTNKETITSSYSVIGRYAVGGYVGIHEYPGQRAHGRINASVVSSANSLVKVYGRCYVGGVLGYSSSYEIGIPESGKSCNINNMRICGDYFVGGIAGGLSDNIENGCIIDFVKRINVGNNVSVDAKCFAGGIAGLFNVNPYINWSTYKSFTDIKNTNNEWAYKLANESCVYDGNNSLTNTYNNIVIKDLNNESPFNKDTRANIIKFNDYGTDNKVTNKVNVTSDLFAGGLFGYVPTGLDLTVEGFVNDGQIKANKFVESSNIKYSYLGGVIGRVPSGMKIVNCANLQTGDNYNSVATYLGGLTEVNAGLISGKTDSNGVAATENYLVNSTNFDNYRSGGIGAIAGENSGTIQYCNNKASVSSDDGFAGGIAAVNSGEATIKYCINIGTIGKDTTQKCAGIVATPSGSDTIDHCRNYGKINGSSKYGIAAGTVGSVSKNLEASGLSEDGLAHDPVANNSTTTLTNNFYIYGTKNSSGSSSSQTVMANIDNDGEVSYNVASAGSVYIDVNSIYNRTNKTGGRYQFWLGKDKSFDIIYNISRDIGDGQTHGVEMKDFNVAWSPWDTTTEIKYSFSIIYKYLDADGNEKTTTVDGVERNLYGSLYALDSIKAPQDVEITQVTLRMTYDDNMASLNNGADGCNVLYDYVYWTDINGKHYILRDGESLSANRGYISFDAKVLAGTGQEIYSGGNYFYDRSPSPGYDENNGCYKLWLNKNNQYDYFRDISIDVNSPLTGLEMNKLKIYWYYNGFNINKYFNYDVKLTYLDSDLNEQTVTYRRKFDGFNEPISGNASTYTMFYDEIPAVDADGNLIYPTKINVITSVLDKDGNIINDSRVNESYCIGAITWFDKNGNERKIENTENKYKLNDTDTRSYVTVDTSAYISGQPYLVDEGSQAGSSDHWSKQLYINQTTDGKYNITYKRNGEYKDNLMSTGMQVDYTSDTYNAEQKCSGFDSWFIDQFIDNDTYFGPGQEERFVGTGG